MLQAAQAAARTLAGCNVVASGSLVSGAGAEFCRYLHRLAEGALAGVGRTRGSGVPGGRERGRGERRGGRGRGGGGGGGMGRGRASRSSLTDQATASAPAPNRVHGGLAPADHVPGRSLGLRSCRHGHRNDRHLDGFRPFGSDRAGEAARIAEQLGTAPGGWAARRRRPICARPRGDVDPRGGDRHPQRLEQRSRGTAAADAELRSAFPGRFCSASASGIPRRRATTAGR